MFLAHLVSVIVLLVSKALRTIIIALRNMKACLGFNVYLCFKAS
jgi:hypothetical protein